MTTFKRRHAATFVMWRGNKAHPLNQKNNAININTD